MDHTNSAHNHCQDNSCKYSGPSELRLAWEYYQRSRDEFCSQLATTDEGLEDIAEPSIVKSMLQMVTEKRVRRVPLNADGDIKINDTDLVTAFSFVQRHRSRGLSDRDKQLRAEYENRSLTVGWFRNDRQAQFRASIPESLKAAIFIGKLRYSRAADWILYAVLESLRLGKLSLYLGVAEFVELTGMSAATFWRTIAVLRAKGLIVRGWSFKDAPDEHKSEYAVHKNKNFYVAGPVLRELLENDGPQRMRAARSMRRAAAAERRARLDYPGFTEWVQLVAEALERKDDLRALVAQGDQKKAAEVGKAWDRFQSRKATAEELLNASAREAVDAHTTAEVNAAGGSMQAAIEPEKPHETAVRHLSEQNIRDTEVLRVVSSIEVIDVSSCDNLPDGRELAERKEGPGPLPRNTLRACSPPSDEPPSTPRAEKTQHVSQIVSGLLGKSSSTRRVESPPDDPIPPEPARGQKGRVPDYESTRNWTPEQHRAPDDGERQRVAAMLEKQLAKMRGQNFFS